MPARSAVIRGFVQGVGFRAYVIDLASDLGVSGAVWNRSDGAVQTVYEHEDSGILEEFERKLRGGPGRVESVEAEALENPLGAVGFRVGPIA